MTQNMVTPEQQSRVKTRPVELIIKLFALIRMAADYPSKPALGFTKFRLNPPASCGVQAASILEVYYL